MKNYSQQTTPILEEMMNDIFPVLMEKSFNKEINYHSCKVEILNDDHSTVWVKWGPHDCAFKDLPLRAMATIADNMLN